jgi:hypothetical protein
LKLLNSRVKYSGTKRDYKSKGGDDDTTKNKRDQMQDK